MNVTFYVQVLDHLCKSIARVRLEMWRDRKFFLLHHNAHPHTAAIIQQFWAKKGMAQLSHSIFTRFKPLLQLFCFLKIKIGAERWPLCCDRRHPEICNHESESVPDFWLRISYETAQRSRQQVYSSFRRLSQINIMYLDF